jgi:hypothetical protein
MKVIINEEQLRQIIESEGGNNLFTIPAHFLKSKLNAIVDNYKKKKDYDGLRVMGNLNLEKLPSDVVQKILNELIEVDGYLYIRRRDIESLGKLKRVKGSLGVTGCRKLESFGNLESVGGDLNIGLTPLAKLSDEKIKNQIEIKGEIYR